eukprot:jgi/Chrzof1/8512/Cz03g13240.t1
MSSSEDDQPGPSTPPRVEDDNAALPALFWDTMPEQYEEQPDYVALKALEEESTPEERAENFKVQGNKKLEVGLKAKNKLLLRDAIDFYAKGLALKCSDVALNTALYNNRAHVHSLLGNWRKALQDSLSAKQLDPHNVKAVFRASRAASKLKDLEQAEKLCAEGLALDPTNKDLQQVVQDIEQQHQKAAQQQQQQQQHQQQLLAPAKKLAEGISSRGYRLTRPQVSVGSRKPYVDDDDVMHWPVLLMYPETMQQDVIEDVCEDHVMADHLDVMFGPDAPPLEWDKDQEYTRDRVELYYLANSGRPLSQDQLVSAMQGQWPDDYTDVGPQRYGDNAAYWCRVNEQQTLQEILWLPDHIIPGVPLFWVVAEGTQYKDRFLAQQLKA